MSHTKLIGGILILMVVMIFGVFAFIIQPALNNTDDPAQAPVLHDILQEDEFTVELVLYLAPPGAITEVTVTPDDTAVPSVYWLQESTIRGRVVAGRWREGYSVHVVAKWFNGHEEITSQYVFYVERFTGE